MNADCLSISSHNDLIILGNTRARLNCVKTPNRSGVFVVCYSVYIHSMILTLSYVRSKYERRMRCIIVLRMYVFILRTPYTGGYPFSPSPKLLEMQGLVADGRRGRVAL